MHFFWPIHNTYISRPRPVLYFCKKTVDVLWKCKTHIFFSLLQFSPKNVDVCSFHHATFSLALLNEIIILSSANGKRSANVNPPLASVCVLLVYLIATTTTTRILQRIINVTWEKSNGLILAQSYDMTKPIHLIGKNLNCPGASIFSK